MRYHADAGAGSRIVELDGDQTLLDGEVVECIVDSGERGGRIRVRFNGRTLSGFATRSADGWRVVLDGAWYVVKVEDERTHTLRKLVAASAPPPSGYQVRAPMPGLVVRLPVRQGEAVSVGDGLVVMEAMKMENELCAHGAGIVECIHVEEGMTVERDTLLVTVKQETT